MPVMLVQLKRLVVQPLLAVSLLLASGPHNHLHGAFKIFVTPLLVELGRFVVEGVKILFEILGEVLVIFDPLVDHVLLCAICIFEVFEILGLFV